MLTNIDDAKKSVQPSNVRPSILKSPAVLRVLALSAASMLGVGVSGCTENSRAKKFGGTSTIDVAENQKVVNVTWKEGGNLWILTRPMRDGETAETWKFQEKSNLGLMEGTVLLKEKKNQ